ncbi:MAG: sulfatase-like hydrolase/transferase, partial [Vicinamibacteria bacterium]
MVESEAGRPREVWSREIRPGDEVGEVRAPLGVAPGTPVRLSLRVGGGTRGAAWGIWEAPRVLARDRPAPAVAPRTAPVDDRRAAPLRQRLRGVSVLLIVLDAAGARHFGCYGYPRATTPEVDAIAREGITFDHAYATGCYTRAAMGSVWTSQFP